MAPSLGYALFATRWLQAPLYFGLVAAQGVYVYKFFSGLWHLVLHIVTGQADETHVMLAVLKLVDVVMIANLLIMVIVGGYETFVSRIGLQGHRDQPEWLSHVNSNVLKVKLATAIVGISSVHLLQMFVDVDHTPQHSLLWGTVIHMAFILSAAILAYMSGPMENGSSHGNGGGSHGSRPETPNAPDSAPGPHPRDDQGEFGPPTLRQIFPAQGKGDPKDSWDAREADGRRAPVSSAPKELRDVRDGREAPTAPAGPEPRGFNGVNGAHTMNGGRAANGANGAAGINGVNGIKDVNGGHGLNGVRGAQGAHDGQDVRGVNGVDGVNGSHGVNGVNGTGGVRDASVEERIRAAGFPARKLLEEFDDDHQRFLDWETITRLGTLDFLDAHGNAVFLGPPGTGKTHLAIALGIRACRAGREVRFASGVEWIARLSEAQAAGRLAEELAELDRCALLIVDEIGYVPFGPEATNLLFQLVAHRYERGSIVVTSDKPLGRWTEVFGDGPITFAMIDRLAHHAEIVTLKGDSYRLRGHSEGSGLDRMLASASDGH